MYKKFVRNPYFQKGYAQIFIVKEYRLLLNRCLRGG